MGNDGVLSQIGQMTTGQSLHVYLVLAPYTHTRGNDLQSYRLSKENIANVHGNSFLYVRYEMGLIENPQF